MTSKKLPPKLAKMLNRLISSSPEWVSTIDFLRDGILNPTPGIGELRKRGVVLEAKSVEVVLPNGNVHKRVRHYRLIGWQYE